MPENSNISHEYMLGIVPRGGSVAKPFKKILREIRKIFYENSVSKE